MKYIKKWYYLLFLLAAGIAYMQFVDQWQVYSQILQRVEDFGYKLIGYESVTGKEGDKINSGQNVTDGGKEIQEEGSEAGQMRADGSDTENEMGGNADAGESTNQNVNIGEIDGNNEETEENEWPRFMTVSEEYFADAVFIGDSRTVGLYKYAGLEETATFYASTGLSVYTVFSAKMIEEPGQKKKITIEEALANHSFRKIYIMLGINELGTGTAETFAEKYRQVLERLQELQPDAIIYIQAIMKVSTKRSGQGDYVTNEEIELRNEELVKLADNEKIFFLDVNPNVCDEDGGLEASYSYDGVHLKAQYVDIWKDFLLKHAIFSLD